MWYSVRCVVHWTKRQAFEERITAWEAESFEKAIELAESEASTYAANDPEQQIQVVGLSQAYFVGPEPRIESGTEIFSLIRESTLEPSKYIDRFFDTGSERQTAH